MGKIVQKGIRFPEYIVALIEKRAQKTMGIGFNEYVKFLVMKKAYEITNEKNNISDLSDFYLDPYIEQASPELEEEIGEAMEEFKAGRYVTVRNPKELDDFFKSIEIDKNESK